MTTRACDYCLDLKHYKCKRIDCGCTVCVSTWKDIAYDRTPRKVTRKRPKQKREAQDGSWTPADCSFPSGYPSLPPAGSRNRITEAEKDWIAQAVLDLVREIGRHPENRTPHGL